MIPASLRDRPQWLVWKFINKPGVKKPAKVPHYASGSLRRGEQGSDEDRAQLVDYDTAVGAAAGGFDGIGFAFLPGDGLIGIDLDACLQSDDEQRTSRAQSIIRACGSYTELSPSGNGVHIIVEGSTDTFKSNALGIEVFCGSQFFTMTGQPYGEPADVQPIAADVLEKLRRTVKGDQRPAQPLAGARPPLPQPDGAARVMSALAMISPDCGYEDWIRIGMAIHAELGPGALDVWDHWSQRSAKYQGSRDLESHWKSFKPGGVTGGTLFKAAMDAGWRPPVQQRIAVPRPAVTIDPDTGEITTPHHPANDNAPTIAPRGFDIASVDWYSPFPDTTGKGKPLATIENIVEACRRLGVVVRYNVVRKDLEILIPGASFTVDNRANASLAWLASACTRFGIPTGALGDMLQYIADQNLYNPVANWITSKPWDGQSRLDDLCSTIQAEDEQLKCVLLRRWLVSAVAAVFNPNGVSAHGVLVLQGSQYLGKTKWFKSLVPADLGVIQDGLMLRPDDRDSVKQVVSYWLVELGELDATFRKSDIAALKSFLTRDRDVLRRAYAKMESEYARRTVFFGSVNPTEYLHDQTGNRRYWTIAAKWIDHSHNIDMQQLWAEVHQLWQQGEPYYLAPEEMERLNRSNADFEVVDPVQDRINSRLNWSADPSSWKWKSATDILIDVGIDKPTQSDATRAAAYIREKNGNEGKRTARGRVLWCPPKIVMY